MTGRSGASDEGSEEWRLDKTYDTNFKLTTNPTFENQSEVCVPCLDENTKLKSKLRSNMRASEH